MLRCFLFLFLLVNNIAGAKKVILYMDHATSPTMQQLMHFSEHADEKEIAFGFYFNRLEIKPELVSDLDDVYIVSKIDKEELPFNHYLLSLLEKYPEGLEVDIHSNLHYSYGNIKPIISLEYENKKIKINHIYLYDDGSIEYEQFEKLRNENIADRIVLQNKIFGDFVNKQIDPQTQSKNFDYLLRHVYPAYYPTTYFYLRPDYVENEEFLQPLRDFYQQHHAKISTFSGDYFSKLSAKQQDFYLKLINVEPAILKIFDNDKRNFVFIGTNEKAFVNSDINQVAKYQANLLKHYVDPKGLFYAGNDVKVYYKGHPAAKKLNELVMHMVPDVSEIPAHISFNTLLMLNAKIDYVVGMQSTIFLNLPKEQIGEIFFTDKHGKSREDLFNNPLVKIFQNLNNLSGKKIQKIEDLPMLIH